MNNENEWNFLMEWHQLSLLQNPNIQVIFWVARGQKKGGELHWQWLMVFSVAIVILDNSLDYAVLVDRHYTIRVVLIFVGTLSNLNITNYKFLLHMHVISATNPHYYCKIVPFIKGNCSQNPIRINFFTDLLLRLSATIHFLFVLTCAIFCTHNAGTPDTSAESLCSLSLPRNISALIPQQLNPHEMKHETNWKHKSNFVCLYKQKSISYGEGISIKTPIFPSLLYYLLTCHVARNVVSLVYMGAFALKESKTRDSPLPKSRIFTNSTVFCTRLQVFADGYIYSTLHRLQMCCELCRVYLQPRGTHRVGEKAKRKRNSYTHI